MSTQNQIGLNFDNLLQLNEINRPDKEQKPFNQSGGQSVLDFIITKNAKARRTYGARGEFEVPIIGDTNRVAEVSSNAIVGTDLRVNFVDTTEERFRVGEVLMDGSAGRFTGRVISKGAGFVILKKTPDILAWNTAIHFVTGSFTTDGWVAAPGRSLAGPTSLFNVPKYVKFRTSAIRDAITLNREDFTDTYINPETGMFALSQVDYMLERIENAKEMKALYSKFGSQLEQDGEVSYSEGFFESVKKAETGGIYRPIGNEYTLDDFEEFSGAIADRRNEQKTRLSFLMGRHGLRVIQNFPKISDAVKFTGIENTFGGVKVEGYDVYNYSFAGISCEFGILPTLNNVRKFPTQSSVTSKGTREQYTIICIDTGYRPTKEGTIVPAVEKIYFGDREETMGHVRGSVASFAMGGVGAQTGNINGANSSNSVTIDYESNCAYRWLPYYMGLMEISQ